MAALGLVAPRLVAAQDAAPPLEENPKTAHFKDVERGTFVGFQFGYRGSSTRPSRTPRSNPGAEAARADARAAWWWRSRSAGTSPRGSRSRSSPRARNERASTDYGAFSIYGVGLDARYAYYGSKDRNDWERFFLYVHARGAYSKSYPKGLFGTNEVLIQAGPGLEYFTRLRHFSIGSALDYVYATKAKASGFAVYPTVRYTF